MCYRPCMSAELIAIIAVGIALAGLLQIRINRLEDRQRAELAELKAELEERQQAGLAELEERQRQGMAALERRLTVLEDRFGALEKGLAELRERMARLEGLLEGLREAVTRPQVA